MVKVTETYKKEEVVVTKDVRHVVLELTEHEASAIHTVLGSLCTAGGVLTTGPIYHALDKLRLKQFYAFDKGGNGNPFLTNV